MKIATIGKTEVAVNRVASMIRPSIAASIVLPSIDTEQIRRILSDHPSVLVLCDLSTEDIERVVAVCKDIDSEVALISVQANLKGASSAIAAGADSIALLEPTCECVLLTAIETGRRAASRRAQLERHISKLEQRASYRRVIGQAVELLAEKRRVPCLESRRLLRREARNRRCTMYEMAKTVIEASQLLMPDSPAQREEPTLEPDITRSKR